MYYILSIYLSIYIDMRQTTEHTKSDQSDEEDIPPRKSKSTDQQTSLDSDLRPPYSI